MDAPAPTDTKQQRYSRRQTSQGRDIGSIPAIVDQERRDAARMCLRTHLETYHAADFEIGWSPSHLLLINAIQTAIFEGLQQAIGYPRGSGKTTICQRGVMWGALHGHRRFPMIFAAESTKATGHLKTIKLELMSNDMLLEDFPEVCFPFRCTEGIAQRANHQTCRGEPTDIELGSDNIVFPRVDETIARGNSEIIIGVGTVTGSAARGSLVRGTRPDLALIDDPQTDKSAKSPVMIQERTKSINAGILGMAGPNKSIAALMTCTVIAKDDLADKHLDRKIRPEWHGIRVKMMDSMPVNMTMWDQWSDLMREKHENDLPLDDVHQFYIDNREKMDEGAKIYWDGRIWPGFVSAIETAMFFYYRDPAVFASEFQNEPVEMDSDEGMPSVEIIRKQTNDRRKRAVPRNVEKITAFVDVQKKMLFFVVVGWEANFTGHVLEYGTWPDQRRKYFTKLDARVTMGHKVPGASWETCLNKALKSLILEQLNHPYIREDGVEMRIERGLVDAQWGESTATVYSMLADSKVAPVWMPSHGMAVRASQKALNDVAQKRKSKTKVGVHWRVTKHEQYKIERVTFDANFWKSFHAARWNTEPGDPGSMFLHGRRDHLLFAEHLNAEYGILVESGGRSVTEWKAKPGQDNDWLDGMIGNSVAASMLGIKTQSIRAMIPKTESDLPAVTAANVAQFYS